MQENHAIYPGYAGRGDIDGANGKVGSAVNEDAGLVRGARAIGDARERGRDTAAQRVNASLTAGRESKAKRQKPECQHPEKHIRVRSRIR